MFLMLFCFFHFKKKFCQRVIPLFLFSNEECFDLLMAPLFSTLFHFCLHYAPSFGGRNVCFFSNILNNMLNMVIFLFSFFVSIKALKWFNLAQFNKYVLRAYYVTGIELGRRGHKMNKTWLCVPKRSGEGNGNI